MKPCLNSFEPPRPSYTAVAGENAPQVQQCSSHLSFSKRFRQNALGACAPWVPGTCRRLPSRMSSSASSHTQPAHTQPRHSRNRWVHKLEALRTFSSRSLALVLVSPSSAPRRTPEEAGFIASRRPSVWSESLVSSWSRYTEHTRYLWGMTFHLRVRCSPGLLSCHDGMRTSRDEKTFAISSGKEYSES